MFARHMGAGMLAAWPTHAVVLGTGGKKKERTQITVAARMCAPSAQGFDRVFWCDCAAMQVTRPSVLCVRVVRV